MTVLTIRAQDTATAMDEIVEKLGKDSFIIGTKKIGNEILVKATNKPKKEIKPQKKVNQKFDDLALERIIGVPKRGVGESTLNQIYTFGEKQLTSDLKELKKSNQKSMLTVLREDIFFNLLVENSLGCKFTTTTVDETNKIKSDYLSMSSQYFYLVLI